MEMKGRFFMGRYEAKSLLGEGGMGRVYLAYQYDLKRQVVVKVMHDHIASDPKFRERFEAETLLMAGFQHPYAVTLYDASLNDPQGPCIIMEYIRGVTLEKLLEQNQGRLSPARVGRLLHQVCEVLQAAHQQNIVHRDLKPANIMIVDADTPYEKIKIMDFGLAKLSKGPSIRDMADGSGEFAVGTPAYMCPEQVRGDEMDHRGDLYSLGIIVYEMLTGRLPFTGNDAMDVLLAHATEPPPSFADVGAPDWIPRAVERVVQACLAKDREQRPASARELAQRYQQALEAPGSSHDDPQPEAEESAIMETGLAAAQKYGTDPNTVIFHLEAWMPEAIAAYKLCGFFQDVGAEVMESVPSRIRVRVGHPNTVYHSKGGALSWIGLGKSGLIELELHMEQNDPNRTGVLDIAVLMRSLNGDVPTNPHWLARCKKIFVDLRAYLMGQEGGSRF